jgi:4'-phosphopantetheinyl transferase EntD
MTLPPRLGRIEEALQRLFPPGVAVAACDVTDAGTYRLYPEELAAVAGAVPQRLAEFAAGRQAARQVLGALGHAPTALPMGPDRAPVWPFGVAGSIAHAAGFAVAAARAGGPLGIDVEKDAPLAPDLWPVICRPEELDRLGDTDTGRRVARVFAAKEAVFKAQPQGQRTMFGLDAVSVTLAEHGFDAQFQTSVGVFHAGDRVRGRLAMVEGLILAGVAL